MTSKSPVRVDFAPEVLRVLKRLRKKYPNVAADLKDLTDRLEQGETPGDQIQGVGYTVYKARVRNQDTQKGKSGGYRVIYYVRTANSVIVITMYAKSERADVSTGRIKQIIEEYEQPEA